MRDIGKYRGQRKEGKGWVKGDLIQKNGRAWIVTEFETPKSIKCGGLQILATTYEVIPETVGQQTDLKDKRKDQDLFAGDRVVIGCDVGVLVWDELELCWSLEVEDGSYQSICRFYSYEEIDAVEYIGNEEKP